MFIKAKGSHPEYFLYKMDIQHYIMHKQSVQFGYKKAEFGSGDRADQTLHSLHCLMEPWLPETTAAHVQLL